MSIDPANPYGPPSEAPSATTAAAARTHAWTDGGPGFHDLLETINPLQRIPVPAAAAAQVADAAAAPAASPVLPAHPPIPLVKAGTAAPLPLGARPNAAESAFLAQSSLRQRALVGARAIPQPIPLKLSGQAMPLAPLRMPRATIPPPAASSDVAPGGDIPQRMLDALDKYRRLEQQRGGTIDLQR